MGGVVRRWWWVVALAACGGSPAADDGAASSESSSAGSMPTDTSATTSSSSDEGPVDTSSSTTTHGADSSGGPTTGGGANENGCPADAPSSWVSCEDFDAIDDPASQLAQWNVDGDAFGVEADAGDPDDRALRVTLTPGVQFGGWVTLRFGAGPDAPGVDAPDQRFDEVWVRYTLRTGPDWPGYAIGDVGEVIAMNGANWGIAADLNLRALGSMRLSPLVWTCVFDGQLACDGDNDWAGTLQIAWGAEAPTVLFDAANADVPHCIVAHMRLNTPGSADGAVDVRVDGIDQVAATGMDLRGTWDEFGINAVRFTNFTEPPSQPLDFWIDDVVVATEPLDCG